MPCFSRSLGHIGSTSSMDSGRFAAFPGRGSAANRSGVFELGLGKCQPEFRNLVQKVGFGLIFPTLSTALAHLEEATLHRCGVHSRPPHRPGAASIDQGSRISPGNHPQWPREALRGPGAVFSRPATRNSKKTFFPARAAEVTPASDPGSQLKFHSR